VISFGGVEWRKAVIDAQAKHAEGQHTFGVDGDTGKVVDMKEYGLLESASVKIQTLKTAIEVSEGAKMRCIRIEWGHSLIPSLPPCCCAWMTSCPPEDRRSREEAVCRQWRERARGWARDRNRCHEVSHHASQFVDGMG
jgi:hypothetical protein